jgi:hypothetical protein
LVVEAVEYGPQSRSLKIGVPYRPQPNPGGFAVHRPKILQVTGVAESEAPVLIEAFLAGVDSHERAAPIWTAQQRSRCPVGARKGGLRTIG